MHRSPSPSYALVRAAREGSVAGCTRLLAAGADVNAEDEPGEEAAQTPLEAAVQSGNVALIGLLLSRGAVLKRSQASAGVPLLVHAVLHRRSEAVVRALLEGGADPQDEGESCPPLHAAAHFRRADLVRALLDHGACPDALHQGVCAAAWADESTAAVLAQASLHALLRPGMLHESRRL